MKTGKKISLMIGNIVMATIAYFSFMFFSKNMTIKETIGLALIMNLGTIVYFIEINSNNKEKE